MLCIIIGIGYSKITGDIPTELRWAYVSHGLAILTFHIQMMIEAKVKAFAIG